MSRWTFTTGRAGVGLSVQRLDRARRCPRTPSGPDASAVELGVKFRTDVAGFITGIRFYKGTGNTGHACRQPLDRGGTAAGDGDLHQRDRHRLAASQLSQPGGDRPPTRSTSPPTSRRTVTTPATTITSRTAGVDNGPVHLLQDGVSGGNGVYAYSASSALSRAPPTSRPTTGSTWSSPRARVPTPPRRR